MAGETNSIATRPNAAFIRRYELIELCEASWTTVNIMKIAMALNTIVIGLGSRSPTAAQHEPVKSARATKKTPSVGGEIFGTIPGRSSPPRDAGSAFSV
jgi:hypothetical protein